MSILRGLFLLMLVIAVFTAILHQIVPHSARSPQRIMQTAIDHVEKKERELREASADDDLRRQDMAGGDLHPTPSPLEALITGHGYSCQGILNAVEVPSGDGAFWITCRTQTGSARYRVDTVRNLAEPA